MPYAIIRLEKRDTVAIVKMDKHHERKKDEYKSNPDIDKERTHLNYYFKEPTSTYAHMANERISKMKCRVRKDSVLMVDTFLGGSPEFLQKMNPAEQKEFLKHAYDFVVDYVGEDNILSAVVHMDEKTPHLHVTFTPITADGRLSAKEILGNQQKYIDRQNKFFSHMKLKWNELERGEPSKETGRKHLPVYEFKRVTQEIKKLKERLHEIQNESIENISPEDIILMKNELRELQEKLQVADKKANSPIIEIEIPSDEKMSAAREVLTRKNINFAETSHGISVPKYVEKIINEALSDFKPQKNYISMRKKIALDIDESIYFSNNYEKLLENLQEKGYDVKHGKHIAVRPSNAERFIRLKSLGEYYTEDALKFRIENKDKFYNACRDKISKTSGMEKEFNAAVGEVIGLFYEKRISPRKSNDSEPYSFKNDYRITKLLDCAKIISNENITGENIQDKMDELQSRKTEIYKRIGEMKESQRIRADLINCGGEVYSGGASMSEETKTFLVSYGIEGMQDIENLKEIYSENEKEMQTLNLELEESKQKLSSYMKISALYDDLKHGSYIDKLVHEELERRGDEKEEIE